MGWVESEAEVFKKENTGEWSKRSKTRRVHKSQEADALSKEVKTGKYYTEVKASDFNS